jgi:bifunctional non-homologous end joining protein LigD
MGLRHADCPVRRRQLEEIRMGTRKRTGPLSEYRRKRDFAKTSEPAGRARPLRSARALHFVVQKHAAARLHFDLRLELDGVMKSWAVPKGPSYDPSQRRLAVEVEEHPIEYNRFEGTIPEGEYGAGSVMLWDRGTYAPEGGGGADAVRQGYEDGELKIELRGERLRGGWVLVRTKRAGAKRGKRQWLLIKHRDEYANAMKSVADIDVSVKSGRTMAEIGEDVGGRRVWRSRPQKTRGRKNKRPPTHPSA